jgi:hypothetical protein
MVPKRPTSLFIDRLRNPQSSPDISPTSVASVGTPPAIRSSLPVSSCRIASSVCESPALLQTTNQTEPSMILWHPEDWDGEVPDDVWVRVSALQNEGEPDPVIVLVSPALESGRSLLADLGYPDVKAGSLVPLFVLPAPLLTELLDRHIFKGVGRIVTGVRLMDANALRAFLVLPETIEIHSISPEPAVRNVWSLCIVDLAGRRLDVSDDSGLSWRSSNLIF